MIAKLFGAAVPAWIYEVVIGIVLAIGLTLYLEHRGASHELDKLKASSTALIAKANKTIADEKAAHAADVKANKETLDAATSIANAAVAELDRRVGLFNAYRAAHPDVPRPAGGSGPAVSRECGDRSCGDIAGELAVRGDELARSVGDLSATLQSCQRDRDALTGLPR